MHFEKQIFEGRLPAGARLESTKELARQFAVNPETVQIALKTLMGRGLIERRRGAGTFVRKGVNGRTAAIIFGENDFIKIDRAYFNVLFQRLMKKLPEAGWDFKYFITTEKPECDAAFHELESLVHAGSIRAVIEFCSNKMVKSWIEDECPVPYSMSASNVDFADLIEKGLEHLLKMGRRRPVVFGGKTDYANGIDIRAAAEKVYRRHGLPLEGLMMLDAHSDTGGGYKETIKLLDDGVRFDSVVTMLDSTSRGVIHAFLQRGVRMPEDVALITHANKGIEIFSHIPLTMLEVDPDDIADLMIREITCKAEGRKYVNEMVKPKLIIGKSCGE